MSFVKPLHILLKSNGTMFFSIIRNGLSDFYGKTFKPDALAQEVNMTLRKTNWPHRQGRDPDVHAGMEK